MAVFKCKMCGGSLEVQEGQNTCTCEYCGTEQTLPRLDSEKKANLYDRANHFRRNNDYDKAAGIYEQILNEDSTDAEAYWSLVLCRYGIEYVEDPSTHKRIPTVNRAQYTSIYADEDYKAAIAHADMAQKSVYEKEAAAIDVIQRGILTISEKEAPYDVFICYKETDEAGRRTPDSVLANDLYHQLVQEGFKVFYARITLEDKLGQEYEPYIFAALNSAKVMVVLGTRPEYFKAVWVRNEWSRFLALAKSSNGKKTLIPAYKDMDPYDLPEEFSHLQAQDMSKLGFMQDLIRGIKKITNGNDANVESAGLRQNLNNTSVSTLLKRGRIAIEDHEWQKADELYEGVLNLDAECAEAYLGKCFAKHHCTSIQEVGEHFINVGKSQTNGEKIEALPEDKIHIDEIVKTYVIKGYLDGNDIRKFYGFDRDFYSKEIEQQKLNEMVDQQFSNDTLWNRALLYANVTLKNDMETNMARVKEICLNNLENAKKEDEETKQRITTEYLNHLKKADSNAYNLLKKSERVREDDYQRALSWEKAISNQDDYKKLIELLRKLEGYKDCNELLELYKEKEEKYQTSVRDLQRKRIPLESIKNLASLGDYKDARQIVNKEKRKIIQVMVVIAFIILIFVCAGIVF